MNRTGTTFVILCLSVVLPLAAQVQPPAQPPAASAPETTAPAPQPIPDVEISARASSVRDLVRDAESEILPDARLTQIQTDLPDEQKRLATLRDQTDAHLREAASSSQLKETEKASARVRDRLARWMTDLAPRSKSLESTLQDLQQNRSLWELTRDAERKENLPEAVRNEISKTLEVLQGGEDDARSARDGVLALQASVSQEQSTAEEILTRLRAEMSARSTAIFSVDRPPLWKAFGGTAESDAGLAGQVGEMAHSQWRDVRDYVADEGAPILDWLLLWAGLGALLTLLKRKATAWAQQDPTLESTAAILGRPLAAAAVIVLVLSNIIEIQAPDAFLSVLGIILLLTLLYFLLGAVAKSLHLLLYLLLPLYFLFKLVDLLPLGSVAQRLAIVALSLVGFALCAATLRALRGDQVPLSKSWKGILTQGSRLAILLFAVGLVADVIGRVRLAALLVVGSSDAIFTGISFWVVAVLLRSIVRIGLSTNTAHRLGIAPEHSDVVREKSFLLISLFTTVYWAVFSLRAFDLYQSVAGWIRNALDAKLTIADFSIDLGSILAFVFILWLSFKLADLVGFVLSKLILPRLNMPAGTANAVSRVSRYTTIVLGAVVAVTALGVDFSKTALVAGGLGVGVGFGLQNVVNNFVSGLILLFERPLRVGDIVDLESGSGTVEKIGLRATQIRTWGGADLIVPNAKLISSDVVNRTLNDNRQRIELPVSVAYGTDPEVVAKLLVDTASHVSGVDQDPQPACLFRAFGESSLDLELRVWAAATKCLGVESRLRFAVNKALEDAGITIPFPQRDLHLRSTSTEIPPSNPDDGETQS